MAIFLFENNASSILAASIEAGGLSLVIRAGDGLKFSSPAAGEEFRCMIFDASGNREIIGVTTRSTDNFVVITRGLEGTLSRAWTAGTPISQRLTKAILDQFQLPVTHEEPVSGAIGIPISSDWAERHMDDTLVPDPHIQYIVGDIIEQEPILGNTFNAISSDWAFSFSQGNTIRARDVKSSGISGGDFVAGYFVARTLNFEDENTIDGASLSNSIYTLPSGIYSIDASVPGYQVNNHLARLYNSTASSSIINGTSERSSSSIETGTRSLIKGKFTLSEESEVVIQHRCGSTKLDFGLGEPCGFSGTEETYTEITIKRLG